MKFAFNRIALLPMTGYAVGDPFSSSFGAGLNPPANMPAGGMMQQGQQQQSIPVASGVVPGMASGMTYNPNATEGFAQTQPAEGGGSPLDKYNKMFDNGNNNPSGGRQQQQQGQQQDQQQQQQNQQAQEQMLDLLGVGYSDFLTSGREVQKSFTSGIDSAMVQSALSGNVEDFMSILQQVALNTFATASFGSSKLAGKYANQRFSSFEKSLDERFAKFDQSRATRDMSNLGAKSGIDFNTPALSGMRDMAIKMFAQTYPEAGRDELASMAMQYLQDAASHIVDKTSSSGKEQHQQQEPRREGYDDLFGMR